MEPPARQLTLDGGQFLAHPDQAEGERPGSLAHHLDHRPHLSALDGQAVTVTEVFGKPAHLGCTQGGGLSPHFDEPRQARSRIPLPPPVGVSLRRAQRARAAVSRPQIGATAPGAINRNGRHPRHPEGYAPPHSPGKGTVATSPAAHPHPPRPLGRVEGETLGLGFEMACNSAEEPSR